MKKRFGPLVLLAAAICLAVSLALSVKVRSFPYRLSYAQGQVFHRMLSLWIASVALTGLAGMGLLLSGGGKVSKRVGWSCILIAPALLFFVPNYVHSITGAKNACINNLREIDAAKEQFASTNVLEASAPLSIRDLAPYLKNPNPKCRKGGSYEIGKTDEPPRCSLAQHTL